MDYRTLGLELLRDSARFLFIFLPKCSEHDRRATQAFRPRIDSPRILDSLKRVGRDDRHGVRVNPCRLISLSHYHFDPTLLGDLGELIISTVNDAVGFPNLQERGAFPAEAGLTVPMTIPATAREIIDKVFIVNEAFASY